MNPCFNVRNFTQGFDDPLEYSLTMILMEYLAPPEEAGDLDLVAARQEFLGMLDLEIQIVIRDFRPYLDLLYVDDMTVLTCNFSTLGNLIAIFAVIHDTADGRVRVRRNLDQIETCRKGFLLSFSRGNDSYLATLLVDQSDW